MSTEKGKHYKGVTITHDMIGQPLDPAFIEKHYPMDAMQFQAFKKIMFAGKRGNKDRKQDLLDAIGAIERQIELDEVDVSILENTTEQGARPTKYLDIRARGDCNGCIGLNFRGKCHRLFRESTGVDCCAGGVIFELKEIKD